jgi:membrane fusion protein, multidrug efflux system
LTTSPHARGPDLSRALEARAFGVIIPPAGGTTPWQLLRTRTRMTLLRQVLIIGLIGAAAASWLYLVPAFETVEAVATKRGSKKPPVGIVARGVTSAHEKIRIQVVGTARALRSATLHPAAAGEITGIHFTTDQLVRSGRILLELDSEAEQLAVDLARVRLEDAVRTFKRLARLKSSGAVSNSTHDDSLSALEAARIELKQAEVALADRHVVAPFSGRIGLTEFDIGDRVDMDTAIASLDQRDTLLVRFEVPEALLGRIKKGDRVSANPWSDRDVSRIGDVFDIGSRVDEKTRTFAVRAKLDNPDDALRPGMSFRVTSDVVGTLYPVVPEIAVQWGGDGSFIWVVKDGKARQTRATIVQRQEASILVDADLTPGDQVVIEGFHRMREGRAVAPVNTGKTGS